jgi:hypothetical protein
MRSRHHPTVPSLRQKPTLTHSFEQALDAPWRHLDYLGRAEDPDVRAQELDKIEDGGVAGARARPAALRPPRRGGRVRAGAPSGGGARVGSGLVRWVSGENELAPYDVESVDDRGGPRFIEVKATTSDDPSEPFQISTAELRFAIRNRSRYAIHRVTGGRSAAPRVYRYDDPLGDLEEARGYLQANRAIMAVPG